MPRIPKIVFVLFLSSFFWSLFVTTSFAEGDKVCSGRVTGTTVLSNPNSGKLYFDAHPGPSSDDNGLVPGSILGLTGGVSAPGDRSFAACVDKDAALANDEFQMKGWSWSDNVGFVSFYCKAGKNLEASCGGFDYGVKVTAADLSGERTLLGHAWSDLGYLQFGGHQYGAPKVSSSGVVTGYAYASSGIWVKLDGMKISLPGKQVVEDEVTGACKNKPFVCLEVVPTAKPVVADGNSGYELHLYLKEADGASEMKLSDYKLGPLSFQWKDTVKLDQTVGKKAPYLAKTESPFNAKTGGVLFKPVDVAMPNDQAAGGNGWTKVGYAHYVYSKPVKSYAPTKNYSETTSTEKPVPVNNEVFFTNVIDSSKIESNKLVLEHVSFDLKNIDGTAVQVSGKTISPVIYPNNQNSMSLEFVPNIEVNPMYVDDLKDNIEAYRGIPANITVGTKFVGKLTPTGFKVDLKLAYDEAATKLQCGDKAAFDFYFLKGDFIDPAKKLTSLTFNSLDALASPKTFSVIAEIKTVEGASNSSTEPVSCSAIEGPSIYSVITENIGGTNVIYYSAKEPSTTTVLGNPDVVVQGNIYSGSGAPVFTPTHKTQAGGNVGVDVVRNTVNENIRRHLVDLKPSPGGNCVIQSLKDLNNSSISCGSSYVKLTQIGDEKVAYFKGSKVTFSLNKDASGNSLVEGNWAVVVDDGRTIFADDVYSSDYDFKLSVASLKATNKTCANSNVYVFNEVLNIQANIVSDCSLFSFDGATDANGLPQWTSISERVSSLDKQLLIEGSIASRNTIGGSEPEKGFVVDGTGRVYKLPIDEDTRLLVQNYDLNYLRLSKPSPEVINGMMVDQSCQKALTVEEMVKIKEYFSGVDGAKEVVGENGETCDGIDLSEIWNPDEGLFGDLVPSASASKRAKGLSESDVNPVYVKYRAPYGDSFVFSKQGNNTN
ncbi:hypothetical protein COU74_02825 [Candidatus Peregrinibacteria bacterium CG10_big_fil_rev_8_21_14_0_10_36_19]|nr:MAG: hypothetical protein COU74_02825 [Candidatus Peregrinibacteria bacterium CG10_big_fil_rev_8_21_14_0_10_36_19]